MQVDLYNGCEMVVVAVVQYIFHCIFLKLNGLSNCELMVCWCWFGKIGITAMANSPHRLHIFWSISQGMLCCSLGIKIIGTAHIVCRQGRVYEMIQCPSMGPQQQTHYCRFAAMGPADRKIKNIDWLLQQWRVNVGSTTLSAYVGSWMQISFTYNGMTCLHHIFDVAACTLLFSHCCSLSLGQAVFY